MSTYLQYEVLITWQGQRSRS